MRIKKITAGFLAAAMAVTSLVSVGASADWNMKKGETLDPGYSIGTGNWLAQIYNVGNPDEGRRPIDYGIDLSKVAGVRAVFTVDEDPDLGYLLFEGCIGGSIGIGANGGDIGSYGSKLFNKYNWPGDNNWWGMEYTTEDGEIINTDPNADDDPTDDLPVSTKRIGEHTYELVADYVNPFVEDSVTEVGCMQVFLQQWSDTLNLYTVNSVEILDAKGNVMLLFDEYGHADKENIYMMSPPKPVSGLKLKSRAADALRLGWDKNEDADGYIIEMKSGNTWTRVGKITNNSTVEFKQSKLKTGTAYTFRVKAYKMAGNKALYSGYKTISARTNPSAVSGLKLKARTADAVRLSWAKNTSADGYIIEMKSGNSWTRVGKIDNNSTTEFKKSKLKAGMAYTFRIKAYKMSGKTALYSATKTISVRTNPSAVNGLKLKNSAKDAVRLSWTKNTSADGYIVEMKVNGVWKRAGKITNNSTVEFKKSGLKSKTSYSFRVKAYKMSGKTTLYGATKTLTIKTK